ncbi:MAG: ferredoxin III, nif-specific [Cyanothece sp. SIO1E1]|nr:ferredoxin III, nif-specific [Cyanothece sp. SIO1E1]
MTYLTGLTFGQKDWTPQFLQAINRDTCIGCGRCFKACGRAVMSLIGLNEAGEVVDEDEDDDDVERKVMTIVDADRCIGCQACTRVCPKGCHTHAPMALA